MKRTIIMSGPPGSGKSFLAKSLVEELQADNERGLIISADHWFYGLRDDYTGVPFYSPELIENSFYDFDPTKISLAHANCRNAFRRAMSDKKIHYVIIDNTHIWAAEKAVYYDHASDFGQVEIARLETPLDVCIERNVHDVPRHVIERMHYVHNARDHQGNLRETMPWWNVKVA